MNKEIKNITLNDLRNMSEEQLRRENKKEDIVDANDNKEVTTKIEASIDEYLFSYIPKKHKDYIVSLYKEETGYVAVLSNGKRIDNISNWDSFKRAIRRAIEG